MYTLQFDGLFKPAQGTNPVEQAGFMCYGWLIWKDQKVIARGHGGVARSQAATSNTAEYMALIEGLDALQDMLILQKSGGGLCEQPVTVIGDARSVIDQMQQVSVILSADTRLLNERARQISAQFVQIRWAWTPREKNRAADALTRRAMRQIRWNEKNYQAAVEFIDRPEHSNKTLALVDLRVYQPVEAE
jgi:ribonuclease HI